jgi:hypothetical protein
MNNGTFKHNKPKIKEDEIIVKRRSPYMYHRKTTTPSNLKINTIKKEVEPIIVEETKTDEKEVLNNKIVSLEKQLNALKSVILVNNK